MGFGPMGNLDIDGVLKHGAPSPGLLIRKTLYCAVYLTDRDLQYFTGIRTPSRMFSMSCRCL